MRFKSRGKSRQGGARGGFQAGVDAALKAVRAQLNGRKSVGRAAPSRGRPARRSADRSMGFGSDFEEPDYADRGRGPLRIGYRK